MSELSSLSDTSSSSGSNSITSTPEVHAAHTRSHSSNIIINSSFNNETSSISTNINTIHNSRPTTARSLSATPTITTSINNTTNIASNNNTTNLGRFLPYRLKSYLQRHGPTLEPICIAVPTSVVMFADLRGLNEIVEQQYVGTKRIEQISSTVSDYYDTVVGTVRKWKGDLIYFSGDGALAIWSCAVNLDASTGDTSIKAQCLKAVACAFDLMTQLGEFKYSHFNGEEKRITIHPGVAYGSDIYEMHIGKEGRFEYLLVGDTVVKAQMLARSSREGGHAVIVSKEVWDQVQSEHCQGFPLLMSCMITHVNLDHFHTLLPALAAEILQDQQHESVPPVSQGVSKDPFAMYLPSSVLTQFDPKEQKWIGKFEMKVFATSQRIINDLGGSKNKLFFNENGTSLYGNFCEADSSMQYALSMKAFLEREHISYKIVIVRGNTLSAHCGNNPTRQEFIFLGYKFSFATQLFSYLRTAAAFAATSPQADGHATQPLQRSNGIWCDEQSFQQLQASYNFAKLVGASEQQGDLLTDASPSPAESGINAYRFVDTPASSLATQRTKSTHSFRRSKKFSLLVGRDQEFEALSKRIQEFLSYGSASMHVANSSLPGAIFIEADAGVGKTHLIEYVLSQIKLKQQSSLVDFQVHAIKGTDIYAYSPFHALRSLLRTVLLEPIAVVTTAEDYVSMTQRHITQLLASINPNLAAYAPLLNPVLPRNLTFAHNSTTKALLDDSETQFETLADMLIQLLRHLWNNMSDMESSLPKRIVILVDNVQWVDASTMNILYQIHQELNQHAFLIFCGRPVSTTPIIGATRSRPYGGSNSIFDSKWHKVRQQRSSLFISLSPLTNDETSLMLYSLLSHRGNSVRALSLGVQDRLFEVTRGVPSAVAQLARLVMDAAGVLSDSTWELDVGNLPLCDTMEAMVDQTLNTLDANSQNFIKAASALGYSFSLNALCDIKWANNFVNVQEEAEIQRCVNTLVSKGLLHVRDDLKMSVYDDANPDLFAFTTKDLREIIYMGIPNDTRRELHAAIAEYLEYISENDENLYTCIAFHYERAENWSRSRYFFSKAANRNFGYYAQVECVENLTRAIYSDQRCKDPADRATKANWSEIMGTCHLQRCECQRDLDRAAACFRECLEYLSGGKKFPDSKRALMSRICKHSLRQLFRSRSPRVNPDPLRAHSNKWKERILAKYASSCSFVRNPLLSTYISLRGLNFCAKTDPSGENFQRFSCLVGFALGALGMRSLACKYMDAVPRNCSSSYLLEACIYRGFMMGELESCIPVLQSGFQHFGDMKHWKQHIYFGECLSNVHYLMGDFDKAIALCDAISELATKKNFTSVALNMEITKGFLMVQENHLDSVVALYGRVKEQLELSSENEEALSFSQAMIALAYVKLGDLDEALALAYASVEYLRKCSARNSDHRLNIYTLGKHMQHACDVYLSCWDHIQSMNKAKRTVFHASIKFLFKCFKRWTKIYTAFRASYLLWRGEWERLKLYKPYNNGSGNRNSSNNNRSSSRNSFSRSRSNKSAGGGLSITNRSDGFSSFDGSRRGTLGTHNHVLKFWRDSLHWARIHRCAYHEGLVRYRIAKFCMQHDYLYSGSVYHDDDDGYSSTDHEDENNNDNEQEHERDEEQEKWHQEGNDVMKTTTSNAVTTRKKKRKKTKKEIMVDEVNEHLEMAFNIFSHRIGERWTMENIENVTHEMEMCKTYNLKTLQMIRRCGSFHFF